MFLCISLAALAFAVFNQWWTIQNGGLDSNLRGVSVVMETAMDTNTIVWATGSNGVILRSTNSGKNWKRLHIPDGESLDFRGVQAFDENNAYVMASGEGEKSRIYKTEDGGNTWTKQVSDLRKSFFLDTIVCGDKSHCFALSDPVDGKFVLLSTEDGQRWRELPGDNMPAALANEGAFAASNSALILEGKNLYFGTGGPAARVFHSADLGRTWTVAETPIFSGKPSSGIFSLAAADDTVVAVGGDYQYPKLARNLAAYSYDAGKTWRLAEKMPAGYRSSVTIHGTSFVAAGPTGTEISHDNNRWFSVGANNFNALASLYGEVWAVGPDGTIARFVDHTKAPL